MIEKFIVWSGTQGLLYIARDVNAEGTKMETNIYAFDTVGGDDDEGVREIPPGGACYGFVMAGAVTVWDKINRADGVPLRAGRWFATPDAVRLHLHPDTRVTVAQRLGFRGVRSFGGPIEEAGRLRYIDGCSDTLLAAPPLLGDPCLNHLHFPAGTEQTFHTHPSVRAGAVARGEGWCEVQEAGNVEVRPLVPGMTWMIPAGCVHRFLTTEHELDVIAYHPDSDWGPTDEAHPMLNRTLVDGAPIDNTGAEHAARDLIRHSSGRQ